MEISVDDSRYNLFLLENYMNRLLSRRNRGEMISMLFFNDFSVYYKVSSGSRQWLSEQTKKTKKPKTKM